MVKHSGMRHGLTMSALAVLAASAMVSLTGCTEVDGLAAPVTPGTLTLCIGSGSSSRADAGNSPDKLSPATDEERRINDLRYFIFPEGGGEPITGQLRPLPTPEEMANEAYKTYRIDDVKPGKYRVYVVANYPDCEGAVTENELRHEILSYSGESLPQAGNLPMAYEPLETTEVSQSGSVVTAQLHFTCVKVRYNILFTEESQNKFGHHSGVMITSVNGTNLSSTAPLILGGMPGGEATAFDAPLTSGRYYGSYERDDDAPDDEDVIKVGDDVPGNFTSTWAYQGTLYLPERYVSDSSDQSKLVLKGKIVDESYSPGSDGSVADTDAAASEVEYVIDLGHSNGEGQPLQFPRGTYYEIIAEILSRNVTQLDAEVRVMDWTPMMMSDFGHTTLTVNKTVASVNSLEGDSIFYTSNAAEVTFGCDVVYDDKPLIVLSEHDALHNKIVFGINPQIPISAYREGSDLPPVGTTRLWLQANNLRKYIDVDYEVTPLFEVTPLLSTIYWLRDISSDPSYTATFSYRTNLGGIACDKFGQTITVGNSSIKVECGNPTEAIGTFTVTAVTDPVTTTEHFLTVSPLGDGYPQLSQEIQVNVKPPFGDYRIYFRPINDDQDDSGVYANTPWGGIKPENLHEGNDNWYWTSIWRDAYLYMYTQLGETIGGQIPDYNVWLFTNTFPGNMMTGDDTNKGWMYYTISANATGVNAKNDGTVKAIKPGETLMMFSSSLANSNNGLVSHRCPHHLDPGITLFDYEDNEGWVLFDPLTDPFYKVYDERPDIHDVDYTIYSMIKPTKWDINYGVRDIIYGNKFSISDNYLIYNSVRDNVSGLYKTTFRLKAPEDDYSKAIIIYFEDGQSSMLFGGGNFKKADNKAEGYYLNGKWDMNELPLPYVGEDEICFYKGNDWSQVYVYAYNDIGDELSPWPGVLMTPMGNNYYKATIDRKYTYVIFNNGQTQLPTFPRQGYQYYTTSGIIK